MRETILLFSGILLLSGSTNFDALVGSIVAQQHRDASNRTVQIASRNAPKEAPHSGKRKTTNNTTSSPRKPALHPAVDREDITPGHREITNQILRVMPERCTGLLKNFYVRYDNPESRGLGGKSTIILSGTVPDDEFRALFVHEFGHLVDLGCFQGSPSSPATPFRDQGEQIWEDDPSVSFYRISWTDAEAHRSGTVAEDFVSGYASWDPFEDFAESLVYFVLHRDAFAERARENAALAAKYLWFQQHLPTVPRMAASLVRWDGRVPWDSTKLPYEWRTEETMVQREE